MYLCGSTSADGTMGRRIDPSWRHIYLFLVPAYAPRLVNKDRVCGMVHIKEPLLLIEKCSPYTVSFPSVWSFTICPTSYNHK